jgi:type IV secretory pathway TrbD component
MLLSAISTYGRDKSPEEQSRQPDEPNMSWNTRELSLSSAMSKYSAAVIVFVLQIWFAFSFSASARAEDTILQTLQRNYRMQNEAMRQRIHQSHEQLRRQQQQHRELRLKNSRMETMTMEGMRTMGGMRRSRRGR